MKHLFSFKLRLLLGIVLLLIIPISFTTPIFSEDNSLDEINKRIDEIKQELDRVRGEKQTLSSTIKYLDNKIRLTSTQIQETEAELTLVGQQIGQLSTEIDKLDVSLGDLTKQLIYRISQTYKRSRINPYIAVISSNDFDQLVNRFKYLQLTQKHTKDVVYQLETARTDYNKQKTLKEKKQDELNTLTTKLEAQRTTLSSQQQSKQQLLEVTKNDEKRYQELLAQAEAQKRAFLRFVDQEGGASILNGQTSCNDWGCYYNQRDSEWATHAMGSSDLSVAEVGCLITSVSMIASHNHVDIKPSDISSETGAFFNDTAYLLHNFSVKGINVKITTASKSLLDNELEAGRPVIVGLYSGPDHFIVIKEKKDGEYIMHDPFMEGGHDRPLSDKYSVSNINSLRLVSFN